MRADPFCRRIFGQGTAYTGARAPVYCNPERDGTDTKETHGTVKPPALHFPQENEGGALHNVRNYKEERQMPKMKTKRAAAKRFKVTGTGKIKRFKAYKRHILTKKSTKRKRDLRQSTILDETNVKNMKKVMPYL